MRLIDADEFMENLIYCDGLGRRGLEAVLKTLKEQPTAYDISKVVEELKEKSDDIPIQYEDNYEKGFDDGIGHAIDIVRKGGVE